MTQQPPQDNAEKNTFWAGRPVLVTGAGGFIGSHLVETLVARGAVVRAFVRYNSRGDPGLLAMLPAEVKAKIDIQAGDLRDGPAVSRALHDATHVFHLGALIAIPYSYQHPVEVVETNILGTLNVLMAARALGTQRVVHTSSSEVYGTALQVPIDEEHPLQGQSPYSASKIGADKIAESFWRSYGLPVVTLRPFNTYGPRQSARAVLPTIITQALNGSCVRLGNLDARRDLTYVRDTVEGFLCVAEVPGIEGETFNIGTGREIRIGDLVRMVVDRIGRPVKIEVDPDRLRPEGSEVHRLLADFSQAQQRLGWHPTVSLEEGLDQTIAWIRDHRDHYQAEKYQI